MAGAALTADEFAIALAGAAGEISQADLTPLLKNASVMISASVKENFAGGHDPFGTPWAPLKRPRENSKGQDLPLRDTGILMASTTAAGPQHVERIEDGGRTLVYGTNLEYAAVHNFGHTFQRPEKRRGKDQKPWVFRVGEQTVFTRRIKAHTQTVPKRQFLGAGPKLIEDLGRLVADWVTRRFRSA